MRRVGHEVEDGRGETASTARLRDEPDESLPDYPRTRMPGATRSGCPLYRERTRDEWAVLQRRHADVLSEQPYGVAATVPTHLPHSRLDRHVRVPQQPRELLGPEHRR